MTHLPETAQARLLKGARTQALAAGQTLFLQDEPSTALFILLEGWIKLYRLAPSGNEAVVDTLAAGQSFGEPAALCDQPRQASAAAICPARLLRIEAGHLRGLLHSDPGLAVSMLAPALMQLQQLAIHVEELKARTTVQRAAEFLLALAAEAGGEPEVTLPYSKALIAGRLGMKPETLSRAFARLRQHGVRVEATTARIEDVERLQALVAAEIACAREAGGRRT